MSHILVTGFPPFSPLTMRGNPSETVARRLGEIYGHAAHVEILPVDAQCLTRVQSLTTAAPRGILMFGAATQVANCVLELEGATKRMGGLIPGERLSSTFAASVADACRSIGMKVGTAPAGPFVYWCLRSYAEALRWAEPRKAPCAFVHVNSVPGLKDIDAQVKMGSELFKMMASAVR